MKRIGIGYILILLVAAALFAVVFLRAGMGFRMEDVVKSCHSVSNEFLPIDDVVRLVDGRVTTMGTIAYVVEDSEKIDGLDRALFAAVAFCLLPRNLSLVDDNCEEVHADYILIDNYSAERDRLVGRQSGYVEIGRTSSTTLFARDFKSATDECIVADKRSMWSMVRQLAVASLVTVVVCALFVWLSGQKLNLGAGWWCALVSVVIVFAVGCLLTHTLRSPNGTAVYAGKAKLMYLSCGLPDDFFLNKDWSVFLPPYPMGLTLLAWIYYVFAGGCDNWSVQLVAFSGIVATILLVLNSFKTVIGRLLSLLFFVSVGTKQIAAGFYPEGFVAAAIIAAMIRMRSGRGDAIAWGALGLAAIFKNEGILFYCLTYFSLRICGMKNLCRSLFVFVGLLPAAAWYMFVRMSGGSMDGYAINGICESAAHMGMALSEMFSFMAIDWKGGTVMLPIFMVCAFIMRIFLRRPLRGFVAVLTRFVLMSLIFILLVYCFCSPFQIRWRIHSSCFRLLWTVAALSLYGMSMIERRLLAKFRIWECASRV